MMNTRSTLGWLPALFDIAVVSMDCTGTVLECSDPALAVLSNGGLSINEGRLIAHESSDQALLQRMFERASAIRKENASAHALAANQKLTSGLPNEIACPRTASFVGAIHIARQEPLPPLQTVMTTVHPTPEHATGGHPVVMLFLCDPARQHSSRSQVLRSLYHLTPTEMRLVDQLVAGVRLKNAAKALNLTENTARFHLKEVFRKMNVDCQSALLSTILLLPSAGDVTASIGPYATGSAGFLPALAPAPYKVSGSRRAKVPQGVDGMAEYTSPGKVFA